MTTPKKKKGGALRGIARRGILILLGLILGFNVYAMNAGAVGNQLPMPFGLGQAVVKSGSMEPTYSVGDLLFVSQKSEYVQGDIVVFQSDGVLVVHRVVSVDGEMITTKGDANNVADDPFSVSEVKGCVVGCLPKAGYIIDFFKTPFGIFLMLAVAVALVEISFQRDKKVKQAEAEKHKRDLKDEISELASEIEAKRSDNS